MSQLPIDHQDPKTRSWIGPTVLLVFCAMIFQPRREPETGNTSPPLFQIDINQASDSELQLLPNVGPKASREIQRYRSEKGRIVSSNQLEEIPGFAAKRIEQLKPAIALESDSP